MSKILKPLLAILVRSRRIQLKGQNMDEILTLAGYPDTCSHCKGRIEKGAMVKFNTFHKTIKHAKCPVKKDEKEGKNDV